MGLLVLRRKAGQAIILNGVITIRVLDIEGGINRVKIGIEAPSDVLVVREELLDENNPHYRPPTSPPNDVA